MKAATVSPFGAIPSSALKQQSVHGGLITVTSQVTMAALQLGSSFFLARVLSKEDFGLQGMVVAVTGVLSLFRDAGLSVPTVQQERVTHEQTSTLFWINVGLGAALMLIGFALAPVLAAFYREPRLLPITLVSACAFLLNSLGIQHRALLNRTMQFATMSIISVTALALSVVVGIVMALSGYGYWSLVAMALSNPLIASFGAWAAMPWMPGRPVRGVGVRSMLRMGGIVTTNSLVVYVAFNAEKVLLGRYWGAAAVGLYGRAYQLANLPIDQMNAALSSVALPALARVQNDRERVCRTFLTGYSVVVTVAITAVLVCAIFPEQLVRVFLGSKWSDSAPVVRLLAPAILALSLMQPFGWLLQATGRAQRSLNIAILMAPVMIAGISLGIASGPEGVAVGYSGAMFSLLIPVVLWSKADTGMSVMEYLGAIRQPFLAGVVAGAAGWYFKLNSIGGTPFVQLVSGVGLMLGVYGLVLLLSSRQRQLMLDLAKQIGSRRATA